MYFASGAFTPEQYDQAIERLEAAGAGSTGGEDGTTSPSPRTGRSRCSTCGSPKRSSRRSEQVLMPILTELGVDPGEPMVSPVHNIIAG